MSSMKLGQPVNIKAGGPNEVLICYPQDKGGIVWDALPPKQFQEKHGAIEHQDLEHLLVLVKDQNGNHAPSVLYDRTVTRADGTKMPFRELMQTARNKLRDLGIPQNFKPERIQHGTWEKDGETLPKYKLEGEKQHFNTPAGIRSQQYQYKNNVATGAAAPDILLHNDDGNGGILVFRQGNDNLTSIDAVKNHYGYKNASLKSTSNFYHEVDYINSKADAWNTADHRFRGYLNEGHIKDLDEVMVGFPNGRMFGADLVLKQLPDSVHAKKLREGPNEANEDILINVRDERKNTYVPIEVASVTSREALSRVAGRLGMHRGNWAETQPNTSGGRELTSEAKRVLFDKYRNAPNVLVQSNGVLYPIADRDVTARGQEFGKTYPDDKIFVATEGPQGGRNGSFRVAAAVHRMPAAAARELAEYTAEPKVPSRFDNSVGAGIADSRTEWQPTNPYATPAATPADTSRFARPGGGEELLFQHSTAADYGDSRRNSSFSMA